jgi:S-adenosylmethionine synthetase
MSLEAAAGKNPVSHVGKIYNRLAHQMAARLCESISGIEEATVWLCSQIGQPLDKPWSIAVELIPARDASTVDCEAATREVIAAELTGLPVLIEHLIRGELSVC